LLFEHDARQQERQRVRERMDAVLGGEAEES
jgi:hypothetical protein